MPAFNIKNKRTLYLSFFSLLRLSLMIFMCSAVMSVTPFCRAQSTQPVSTSFKNTRGTRTSCAHASSVNLISLSRRLAA